MTNKVDLFLKKYHADITDINPNKWINAFLKEMNDGLVKKSSLMMARTYIKHSNLKIVKNKKYIVLDAGGTHLRGALATIKNNKIIFTNFKKEKVPTLNNTKAFYKALKTFITSISKEPLDIGFCFSFYCKMNKNLDGQILDFGKGKKMDHVLGSYVAKELKKEFKHPINIFIVNDAPASTLGAELEHQQKGNYISYILGTGTNISYYEKDELINVESAGFNRFTPNKFEQAVIKKTDPSYPFEKTCGGMYFADVINNALNLANKDKLIKLKKKINLDLPTYCDLNNRSLKQSFIDQNSYLTALEIIHKLIKRIALTNALILVAVIKRINNNKPYYIALEGTTLSKLPNFESNLKKNILKYAPKKNISFLKGENLNLKGALFLIMK